MTGADYSLEVRRVVAAPPRRVFRAWTTPRALLSWWGPTDVRCTEALVELRIGGRYRLGNELPDGRRIFIEGEFVEVEEPTRLVYTWTVSPSLEGSSLVEVRFLDHEQGTEVVVVHQRIADEPTRASHHQGWLGCLDGLVRYCDAAS